MAERTRALLIAEAANPEWVSVPLVGWSLASAIARATDAHIVTQIRNRDAFLRAGLVEGQDFTAIDSEAVAAPAHRIAERLRMGRGKGWTTVMVTNILAYPYFERQLWRRFGAAIRAGEYDVVHRITPLSPTIASPLAPRVARAGVPFVLGPLNGGLPWPPGFDAERRREREWLSYVRGLYKLLPGRSGTLAAARAIVVGSRHTESEIPARFRGKSVYIPENAVDPARFSRAPKETVSDPLRCAFLGRLVPYKGPDMLIEAAAPMLAAGRLRLDVIGDGPMRADLEAQARAAGAAGTVAFHGEVSHDRVQDLLGQADLLTFPSIREFGGGVVLEAMALGVVPVVIDYGGPGELVTPETGIALPLGSRTEIVAALRDRLGALAADPSALPGMGRAAAARIGAFYTWDRKAAQVAAVYDWVLGRGPKPAPFG